MLLMRLFNWVKLQNTPIMSTRQIRLHHVGELAKFRLVLQNVDQAISSTSVLTSLPCKNSEGKNEYADMAE